MNQDTNTDTPERGSPSWWESRYQEGDTPWDLGAVAPEVLRFAAGHPGRGSWALDIGCGTGTHSRELARCGYRVLGIDLSQTALRRAAAIAKAEDMQWWGASASAADLPLQPCRFTVVLDIGCFHSLSDEAAARYAEGLRRVLAPEAFFLLYTAQPPLDPEDGGPPGVSPAAIEAWFSPFLHLAGHEEGWHRRDAVRSDWWLWQNHSAIW